MKIDNIDGSRLGYGRIYFGFSVDIPDEQYWRYSDTDKNYAILVEAILKFKEICEKQKESIENKKQIINNLYGSRNVNAIPCTIDVSDNIYATAVKAFDDYRNYGTTTNAHTRAFKDFTTIWEDDYGSRMIPCSIDSDSKKVNQNDTKNTEENNKETTAFTSGEISW